MRPFAFALLTLCASGCSQLQVASAGEVGCAPRDIQVSETEHAWNTSSWKASCNDTVYQCSSLATAWSVDYSCKPLGEASEDEGTHAGPTDDPTAPPPDMEEDDDEVAADAEEDEESEDEGSDDEGAEEDDDDEGEDDDASDDEGEDDEDEAEDEDDDEDPDGSSD